MLKKKVNHQTILSLKKSVFRIKDRQIVDILLPFNRNNNAIHFILLYRLSRTSQTSQRRNQQLEYKQSQIYKTWRSGFCGFSDYLYRRLDCDQFIKIDIQLVHCAKKVFYFLIVGGLLDDTLSFFVFNSSTKNYLSSLYCVIFLNFFLK